MTAPDEAVALTTELQTLVRELFGDESEAWFQVWKRADAKERESMEMKLRALADGAWL